MKSFTRISLLSLLFLLGTIPLLKAQKQTHISPGAAIVVNSFPSYQHISKASDGGSIGSGTQGTPTGGCNALCCSLWVYRVDIKVPGSIRVDFTNNVTPLTSGIIAYKGLKKSTSSFNDITYINRLGNFCGFRDSCQLGLFVEWNDKKSILTKRSSNLTDTVGPGSYYFCVFPENQQTSNGKDTSSVRFRFQPFCPSGGVCNFQTVELCDQSTYKLPGGTIVNKSGNYTDTFANAGVGGKDSFVLTSLILGGQLQGQDILSNESLCVGANITKAPSSNLVSEAVFSSADDNWIEINDVADSIAGTNRSVFTWMRKSSQVSGSTQMIHAINTSANANVCLLQIATDEELELYDGSTSRTTGVVVTDGEWHHVGYTYDETTDSALVYVDGVVKLRFKNSQSVSASNKISIGQEFDSGSKKGNYYDGELAEMSVWNEVLSANDVRSLMRSAITNQHSKYKDLVAYYPMITSCATSVDTLYDYSGNNFHGYASSSLIQQTDSLVALSGFESSVQFNKEWFDGGTVIATSDTLNVNVATNGAHTLRLYRDYFEILDSFTVAAGSGCVSAAPEIKLTFNSTEIANDDATPSATDSTNFGSVDTNSTAVLITYTIANIGPDGDTLNLTGNPIVAISGSGASHFSIVSQPSKSQLDSGETTTFQVRFLPSAVGTHSAELSIANDDSDENPYNFSIQGTGNAVALPTPEISVVNAGVEIASADNTPSVADGTDFGNTGSGNTTTVTFYVKNTGTAALKMTLNPILLTGAGKGSEFTVTKQADASVAVGDSSAFSISFSPTKLGAQSITVMIRSNDADEDPYTFDISGTGSAVAAKVCSTYFPAPYKTAFTAGSSILNNAGNYGSVGVASPYFYPHSGGDYASWVDSNNNFYIFGGVDHRTSKRYSSLWKWDGTNWTLLNGSSATNTNGVYGTKGTGTSSTRPGARYGAATFVDANGDFWLFGGEGYGASSFGRLNDLWKWDGSVWTWISGDNTPYSKAVYGTKGVAASSNMISATLGASSWLDENGNFWVFGGYGLNASNHIYKNELWKWDGTNWTFIRGDKVTTESTYGTKGVTAATNTPGSRYYAASWTDDDDNFWLFGGHGQDYNNTRGYLNDIWKFDGTNWTWMHGDSTANIKPNYGEKLVTKSSNNIGGRSRVTQFNDCQGNVYVAGGVYANNNYLNSTVFDLWKWDGSDWTWLQGDTTNIFGTSRGNGTFSYKTWPSAREGAASFYNDSSGIFTVFGGDFNGYGSRRTKNDLWEIDSVFLYSDIAVRYNDSINIKNSSLTINDSFGTDFGVVDTNYANIKRTFGIWNTGNFDLNLEDSVPVRITGTGASHFNIKYQPYHIIDGGRGSLVDIIFRPTTVGVHTATVTIPSNDKDENPFTFNIQGEGRKSSPLDAKLTVVSNANCYNRADGVASAVVSGGKKPYTYLWSNGDTSLTTSALMGGSQSFIVTDAASTQYSASVTIGRPAALPVSIAEGDTIYMDGKDSVMATIASQDTSLRYVWSDISRGGSDVWEPVGKAPFFPSKMDNPSFAITRRGIYAAFEDRDSSDRLTVMRYTNGSWQVVGERGFTLDDAERIAIAVSQSGVSYVAFSDEEYNDKASVMKYNGKSWEYVGAPGISVQSMDEKMSIAFDGDTPYIAFEDNSLSNQATVMKFDGTKWDTVGVAGFSGDDAEDIKLAFDGSTPYVGFIDDDRSDAATVMKFNGTKWDTVGSPAFSDTRITYFDFTISD